MLNGKVALVTGAASGIGRATALAYARQGARVLVSDLDEPAGRHTLAMLRDAGGQGVFIRADVSLPGDAQLMVDAAVEELGGLHIACNNAGIAGDLCPTADYPIESWRRVIDVNLSGVFYGMRCQLQHMLSHGGGAIVNVASILGQVGFPAACAYAAAKHGVLGLTRTAALDHSGQGVRINAVGPAFIHTPMIAALESDATLSAQLQAMHPIGRLGQPEEVAELIVWLSSDAASFVTGSYYPVDGGYLAR